MNRHLRAIAFVLTASCMSVVTRAADTPASENSGVKVTEASSRLQHLQQLMTGRLDARVNIETVLTGNLGDEWFRDLLTPGEAKEKGTDPIVLKWHRLSARMRRVLIQKHMRRYEQHLTTRREEAEQLRLTKGLSEKADQLEAYLAGELSLEVEPARVLSVELGEWLSSGEASDEARRLLELQAKYASLSPQEREDLGKTHSKRKSAAARLRQEETEAQRSRGSGAQTAAEERDAALREAALAASESARLQAEERARLFNHEAALSTLELEQETLRQSVEARHEKALGWARRVREFVELDPFRPDRDRSASALYDELVVELSAWRQELRRAMGGMVTPPALPPLAPLAELKGTPVAGELRKKHAALSAHARQIQESSIRAHREAAEALRDDVVSMNSHRLELLSELGAKHRADLSGVGPLGVAQVKRELEQMALETRFHVMTTRDQLRLSLRRQDSVVVIFALLKLAALVFLFRWWRARAPSWMGAIVSWGRTLGAGPLGPIAATSAWYLQRLRAPAEWYAIMSGSLLIVQGVVQLPEVDYLREVIAWTCLGAFAVRWVDALASKEGQDLDRQQLRFRSLRLVAVGGVSVLLLLRLAELSVGRGALYSWIVRLSLVLLVPLILRLILWWRPTVLERLSSHSDLESLKRWAAKHQTGPASLVLTLVAGMRLLAEGVYRFFLRRVAHLQSAQRILAYLFRKELEKRAAGEEGEYELLSAHQSEALHAVIETPPLVASYAAKELEQCIAGIEAQQGSVIALVAERGLGKTRFGERVREHFETDQVVGVRCLKPGFAAFIRALFAELGGEGDASESNVLALIAEKKPRLIWVDDATRLIRPIIGGLRDFDRLARLARGAGIETTWILGIAQPSWNYLSRAREGRAVVDSVVRLPEWSEVQFVELTRACAKTAGLSLRYDDLVVPSQLDSETETGATERTEQDYCRLLCDFSDGNPMVALHFFVESIRMREDALFVRLFHPPSLASLEEHPISVHFVLRAVLQLGLASEGDIVKCTGLTAPEVADALRLSRGKRYVELKGKRYAVSIPWFRMITQVLRRQHLMIA